MKKKSAKSKKIIARYRIEKFSDLNSFDKFYDPTYLFSYDDYSYENKTNCEEYGCGEEGICRCGRLYNLKINNIPYMALYNSLFNKNIDKIETIKDLLIFNYIKMLSNNDFIISAAKGYYGEEVEISFSDFRKKHIFDFLVELVNSGSSDDELTAIKRKYIDNFNEYKYFSNLRNNISDELKKEALKFGL